MADVRINRLEIRLKGVSFVDARSMQAFGKGLSEIFPQAFFQKAWADALGNELLRQLADQRDMLTNRRTVRLERITPGTFRISGDQRASDLQRTIAGSIVRSILDF